MTNGINTREMILEILLQINEEENTVTLQFAMHSPNISSFPNRRELLSQECAREHWNTEYRLIILLIPFRKFLLIK